MSIALRLVVTLVLLVAVTAGAGGLAWLVATADGPLAQDKVVNIPPGSTSQQIAEVLEREGVVESESLTMLGISGVRRVFDIEPKAGEYAFTAGASLLEVLRQIKRGKLVTYKVTIPEGFTSWQVVERLKATEELAGEITDPPVEGELLPDTYVFSRGRTRQSIIDQMRAAQKRLLGRLWQDRKQDLPFSTPQEAIILASIVEKETGQAEERAQVAGVFINRLRRGMRLQSDPTIIYGITRGQGKLDRPIYRSDIREKTDYNTYQIDGLPPTPIANPGRAAIEAVLNPLDTDYIYFVADGTGGHAFAVTLDEHNANVRKWRAWLREQREEREREERVAEEEQSAQQPSEDGAVAQLRASLDPAANAAPLPSGAETAAGQTGANAAGDSGDAGDAGDAPPPSRFRVVEVSGKRVPIPVAKPAQN
jgi:UPF0755 protein